MSVLPLTLYTLETPVVGQERSVFNTNNANILAYVKTFGTDLNTRITEINTATSDLNTAVTSASNSASIAVASANNNGAWSALTGAFPIGEAVNHNGSTWISNVAIADVTLSEPTAINTDWTSTGISSADLALKEDISNPIAVMPLLDVDRSNGAWQSKTLTADEAWTSSLADGEWVKITHTNGGFTVTGIWDTAIWVSVGNVAPTLNTTDIILFWNEGGTLYAKHIGIIA